MTNLRIRVVIVDDHKLYADSLEGLLRDVPNLEVVGRALSSSAAVRLVQEQRPDVALVDYRLPGDDGIATAARLRGAVSGLRVIILTGMATAGLVTQALAAGCSGFVTKDRSADEIVTAIQRAYAGEIFVSPVHCAARSADRSADPSLPLEGTATASDGGPNPVES